VIVRSKEQRTMIQAGPKAPKEFPAARTNTLSGANAYIKLQLWWKLLELALQRCNHAPFWVEVRLNAQLPVRFGVGIR